MSYRLRSIPLVDLDIEENPLKYQSLKWDVRRALTQRFPYAIYFLIEGDAVVVLAVLHAARHPSRWQRRSTYRVSEP